MLRSLWSLSQANDTRRRVGGRGRFTVQESRVSGVGVPPHRCRRALPRRELPGMALRPEIVETHWRDFEDEEGFDAVYTDKESSISTIWGGTLRKLAWYMTAAYAHKSSSALANTRAQPCRQFVHEIYEAPVITAFSEEGSGGADFEGKAVQNMPLIPTRRLLTLGHQDATTQKEM